jgi:ProP effector
MRVSEALPEPRRETQTLRANAKQRTVLFERSRATLPAPPPKPAPPPSPKREHHAALGKRMTARALDVRAILARRFPLCFGGFGEPKRPLKIGIVVDAIVGCPDIKPHAVALAIADYCWGETYHRSMLEGAARIDLHGNAAGTVTKSAAERARNILKKVFKANCAAAQPP